MRDEEPKYLGLPGIESARIYHPDAFFSPEPFIAICEGEIDAITCNIAGIPAVGIAGVTNWREWFRRAFGGYDAVFIMQDGDKMNAQTGTRPGEQFALKLAEQVENAQIIPFSEGEDVNSFFVANGAEALRRKVGLK